MSNTALGKRKAVEEVDPRAAQAGSPVALVLFDLLADPASTLRGLLRVSDLFCVRLTCKEAWRCIQHQPLTRRGVLLAAMGERYADGHHVPLLRWCLRNGIFDTYKEDSYIRTIGETRDAKLVSELLTTEPRTDEMMGELLFGVAKAGDDELAFQLLADFAELPNVELSGDFIMEGVALGGCVRTAAAINGDPRAWHRVLSCMLCEGQLPLVQWVLADVEPTADAPHMANAASSGSLELVKWLCAKGYRVGRRALTSAAASGNVDLCKWMVDRGLAPTRKTVRAAVTSERVEVLEWLSSKGCRCTSELLREAVRTAGVPVVAWCLDHHPHPPDAGDLLALSCESEWGSDVFEYLADERGFESSPTKLMRAAEECHTEDMMNPFDAAILVKRYGTSLYPGYMFDAIMRGDLGRLRFGLSQGQEVSSDCYEELIEVDDATLLNEVLLARKVGGSIPEIDRKLIGIALSENKCHPNAKKVLADHSIFVCYGVCECPCRR
jgi:hypothetical protein